VKGTVARLSLFLALCLFFTALLAFTIGNVNYRDPLDRNTYTISAVFDDVTGLLPNDNVKIAGVAIGKVSGIKLVDGRAKVSMKLRKGYRVPSDTEAAVRWRNLLGQRYVYLYPGTSPVVMTKGATIEKTRSVVDLGELFNRLGPIVKAIDPQQVNTFLDSIVQALDGNEGAVRSAIADLGTVTSAIAQRDQAIGRLLDNLATVSDTIVDRDAQIRQTLDNLVALATTFSENTAVVDQAITSLGSISQDLAALLRNNRGQVDSIIANLVVVVKTVQAKLPQLNDVLANLDKATAALFRSGRYGEWLNQALPCGRLTIGPGLDEDLPCDIARAGNAIPLPDLGDVLGPITGPLLGASTAAPAGDAAVPPASTAAPGAPSPGRITEGAAAVAQLLGVPLQPAGDRR
jgi:phospholipid/cholesterol/gamma-HCH transport system substrate-binding protein